MNISTKMNFHSTRIPSYHNGNNIRIANSDSLPVGIKVAGLDSHLRIFLDNPFTRPKKYETKLVEYMAKKAYSKIEQYVAIHYPNCVAITFFIQTRWISVWLHNKINKTCIRNSDKKRPLEMHRLFVRSDNINYLPFITWDFDVNIKTSNTIKTLIELLNRDTQETKTVISETSSEPAAEEVVEDEEDDDEAITIYEKHYNGKSFGVDANMDIYNVFCDENS